MNNTLDRLAAALADRYRLERELGAGGMATVYPARNVYRNSTFTAAARSHPRLTRV